MIMNELIFATNNKNKLSELKQIIGTKFKLLSLSDINYSKEIPEDYETLAENALQKARTIHEYSDKNCFADDTGLEIDALNGEPGVYSARFAGENATYEDNVQKTLKLLKGKTNRTARFKTVIALILENKEYLFEGMVEGEITEEKHGDEGFGYDPIFRPKGKNKTFAEMSGEEKHAISHRGRAVEKLVEFLKKW